MPNVTDTVKAVAGTSALIAFPSAPAVVAPRPEAGLPGAVAAPLFRRENLPQRLQAVVTTLANHLGITLESAALLAVTHFASWCGERSGCYSVDETWTPAACNQIVVFEEAGVMQRAREFLLDEFCRMEVPPLRLAH